MSTKAEKVTVPPSIAGACAELGRLAGEVQAWARAVEEGRAAPSRAELERLKVLLVTLRRGAGNVVDLAEVERDQSRALPPGWRP